MSVLPWRWRTRSGRARANFLLKLWRFGIVNALIKDLTNTNGAVIASFFRFKAALASYRLTTKDNPSIQFLTELNILDSPGVSQLERDSAKERIWKILRDEANSFIITDPASSHNDSSDNDDDDKSEGYSSMNGDNPQIATRLQWRWRTRSGTARAADLMQRWRAGGNVLLRKRLDKTDGNDAAIKSLYYVFKRLLVSYRLTNKDNPSIRLLTELAIIDKPGVSELEKKDATDRLWEFLHCKADSIIINDNSADEDSDNSTDEDGSEGYSSMDEEE